jgi:pimeloyl-ACP methyl ester carboxylesterase
MWDWPLAELRCVELPERGGVMSTYDIGPADRAVDIVFSHANGFNARTYLSILAPVAATRRILLPDLRGHGRTELPAAPAGRTTWLDFRDDLLALLAALDLRDVILSGHSMGATTSLLAAAAVEGRVRELVLFEPVVMGANASGEPSEAPIVQGALKRRAEFPSREAAEAAYAGRGAFRSWSPQMLQDYVADGFRDLADSTVTLAAAPAWEHANYLAQAHDSRGALAAIRAPMRILQAEHHSTFGLAREELIALNAGARLEVVDGATHFLPMERPDLVAEALSG